MRPIRRAPSIGLVATLLACGCERITHSGDFETVDPPRFHGACNECPASGLDLRRPYCPVDSDAPDIDEMFVYVYREYHLGHDRTSWTGPDASEFMLGVDMDCSDRPDHGRPVLCQPRTLPDGSEGEPWVAMPHGIDNAFAQRLFAPLYDKAIAAGGDVDLEQGINEQIAAGNGSVMIVVERWNGTPNDPKVSARIVSVAGISDRNGGPPRWDGSDLWDPLSDGPDATSPHGAPNTTFKSDDAYVANGMLVLDLSFLGTASTTVVNNGARLDMPIRDFLVLGELTPDTIRDISVSGRWGYADMVRAKADVANFLSGCDPLARAFVLGVWPNLVEVAPDLPLGRAATPGEPCEAISVGYGGSAIRARIGENRPVSTLPGGCPSE